MAQTESTAEREDKGGDDTGKDTIKYSLESLVTDLFILFFLRVIEDGLELVLVGIDHCIDHNT